MKSFLEYVAKDILQKYGNDLSRTAIVFPNKRAALFLNQELAKQTDRPIWSPAYITISELFRKHSTLSVADPLKSVAELYKSYTTVTGKTETLDQFFGWGQLLLADFDDIDKNGADAAKVFRNLKDIHEYDDISYLNDNQRKLLKRFFSNFKDDDSTLQRRFLEIWSKLYNVYTDFRQRLQAQGLAYEGMLYKEVVDNPAIEFQYEKYLFVGFNVIQEIEQQLFKRLQAQGKAAYYWDYDQYYKQHDAGVYIRKYLEDFPNELDNPKEDLYDNFSKKKDISFICAPTENIQARYITEWLKDEQRRMGGNKTAIVLCNEGLLQTVVHCFPSEVKTLNVTTGYPLQQTAIASLVHMLLAMQINGYDVRRKTFRQRFLQAVMRHPYIVGKEIKEIAVHQQTTLQLVGWLKNIVRAIATEADDKDELKEESLFRMYTLLNRLEELIENEGLKTDIMTLQRFIKQLISSTTIPFHGEPAVGIQVMGVLETRNLDFDHVLILSCNEGNMPKGVDDSSFIPHALRSAYGLTTIDNKVAIYSYYFHRLIQRAQDVTILYNNATEGSKTGEMSRFMLQLLVEYPYPIRRITLRAGQTPTYIRLQPVEKDQAVMEKLNTLKRLSPTAINHYMRCQLQFYYNYIAGIREQDEYDDEGFDNRVFGNVFHRAAQLIYEDLLPREIITKEDINALLAPNCKKINQVLDQAISEELFHLPEGTVKHPPLNGLQLISREVIETYLHQLLHIDSRQTPFRVIAHEEDAFTDIQLQNRTITVGGRIDRMDEPSEHAIRIVDYKTGRKEAKDIKEIAEIFNPENISNKHTDYIFQTFLYSMIIAEKNPQLAVSPALLFIARAGKEDYSPVLTLCGQPITDIQRQCGEAFKKLLTEKIQEIFDPTNPFTPTNDLKMCSQCPFAQMCGRS